LELNFVAMSKKSYAVRRSQVLTGANRVSLRSNNLHQGTSVFDRIAWPSSVHPNLSEDHAKDLAEFSLPLEFQRLRQSYQYSNSISRNKGKSVSFRDSRPSFSQRPERVIKSIQIGNSNDKGK
jgi:hypothetical protein